MPYAELTGLQNRLPHEHVVCPYIYISHTLVFNDTTTANVADLSYYSDICLVFGLDSKRMTEIVSSLPPKQLALAYTEQYPCKHPS